MTLVRHDKQCVMLQLIDVSVKLAVTDVLAVAVTSIVYAPAAGPTPPKVLVSALKVSPVGREA